MIFAIVVFLAGIGIAFFYGPVYAAICFSYFPLMFIAVALFGNYVKKSTMVKMGYSKQLGGIVEESLSAVKLIVSFA